MASVVISAVQSFADYALVFVGIMMVYYFVLMIMFPFRNREREEIGLTDFGRRLFGRNGTEEVPREEGEEPEEGGEGGEGHIPHPQIPPPGREDLDEEINNLREQLREILDRLQTMENNSNLRIEELQRGLGELGRIFTLNEEQIAEFRRQLENIREELGRETRTIIESEMRLLVQRLEEIRRDIVRDLQQAGQQQSQEEIRPLLDEVRRLNQQIQEMQRSIMELRERMAREMKEMQDQIAKMEKESSKETAGDLSKELREIKEKLDLLERNREHFTQQPINIMLNNCLKVDAKLKAASRSRGGRSSSSSRSRGGNSDSASNYSSNFSSQSIPRSSQSPPGTTSEPQQQEPSNVLPGAGTVRGKARCDVYVNDNNFSSGGTYNLRKGEAVIKVKNGGSGGRLFFQAVGTRYLTLSDIRKRALDAGQESTFKVYIVPENMDDARRVKKHSLFVYGYTGGWADFERMGGWKGVKSKSISKVVISFKV